MMSELLADIRPQVYPQLRCWDALTIWHITRATHTSEVRRGRLSWWLNKFAAKPPAQTRVKTPRKRNNFLLESILLLKPTKFQMKMSPKQKEARFEATDIHDLARSFGIEPL